MLLNPIHAGRLVLSTLLVQVGLSTVEAQTTFNEFTYQIENGEVTLIGYDCGMADVVIPGTIEGLPVTKIRGSAFRNCDTIETITFPESLREIGQLAFWSCSGLKSLTLPEGLEEIGYGAFDECRYIETIELPTTLKTIGNAAFEECSRLTSIEIPAGVESIGNGAFGRCGALAELLVDPGNPNYTSVDNIIFSKDMTVLVQYFPPRTGHYTIPDHVTTIQNAAFQFCEIESLSIHPGITELPESMLATCSRLTEVELPETLVTVGASAFFNCSGLETIILPSNIEVIGDYAFAYCRYLTDLVIPASVENFGKQAFTGTERLASITFEGSPPVVDDIDRFFEDPGPRVYYYSNVDGWGDVFAGIPTQPLQGEGPWRGTPVYVDGWMETRWYGWLQQKSDGWIYHLEHGWQGGVEGTSGSIYAYDALLGDWWFTSESLYPFIYMYGSHIGWYLYSEGGTPGERWFFNWASQAWVQEPVLD